MPISKKNHRQVVPRSLEISPYLEPPASYIKSLSSNKSQKNGTGIPHRLKPNMQFGNREDQNSTNAELRKSGNTRERGYCYDLSDHDTYDQGLKARKENKILQKSRMILLPFEVDQLIEKLGIVDDTASTMSKKFGTVEMPLDDDTIGSDCLGEPFYDDYFYRDVKEEQGSNTFPKERDAYEYTDNVSSSLPELSFKRTFEPNYEVFSSVSDLPFTRMLERNNEVLSVLPELASVKSGGTSKSSNSSGSSRRKQHFQIVNEPLPSDVLMLPRIEQTSRAAIYHKEHDPVVYAEPSKSKRALIDDNPFEKIGVNIYDRSDDVYNDEIFEVVEDDEENEDDGEEEEKAYLDQFETADNAECLSRSDFERYDPGSTLQGNEALSDNDDVEEEEMMFQQVQRRKYRG
jgi:hypothetical protein